MEGPRRSKNGNHKDEDATLGHFAFVEQRAKRGLLHVPRSSLAMSASPWLSQWDASSAQELLLGCPKVTLGVCQRVSALEHTVSGEQPVCRDLWCVTRLNTGQGFHKQTVFPRQLCLVYCSENAASV